MMKKFIKGKAAVFIDAANVLYSQKALGWRVDYIKLKRYFEMQCTLVHIAFYTGKVGAHEKQQKFLNKLSEEDIVVVSKEVKFIKIDGGKLLPKGNLDVELALDAFSRESQFDTLILFSGDSDFAHLLDLLKRKGKQVIVVSTRNHISRELIERAKFIPLDKLREYMEYK